MTKAARETSRGSARSPPAWPIARSVGGCATDSARRSAASWNIVRWSAFRSRLPYRACPQMGMGNTCEDQRYRDTLPPRGSNAGWYGFIVGLLHHPTRAAADPRESSDCPRGQVGAASGATDSLPHDVGAGA